MSRTSFLARPWLSLGAAALLGPALAACNGSDSTGAGEAGVVGGLGVAGGAVAKRVPFISAHRGGSAYAPEDTLTAYRNAQRLGVDDFETDTQFTKDKVLVIIHDSTLDRTTNCTGNVQDMNYADLRAKCDAGYYWAPNQATTVKVSPDTLSHPYRGKGVYVPTAKELFAYAATLGTATTGPTVTIEIKNIPSEANYEAGCMTAPPALVDLIHQSGIQPRITVQSFDTACIDAVRKIDPTIKTLYLTASGAAANVAYCKAMGHTFASPSYTSPDFTAQVISTAHMEGVKVNPYTVDTVAAMKSVTDMGVDGFITNFPACAMQRIGETPPAVLTAPEAGGGVVTNLCSDGSGTS